jgi:CRISPR-associated protein Cmr1
MKTLEATYRIVTPMFIGDGDAEQKATDLRPPSIKGALRFWWRALNWKTYLQQADGNMAEALRQLHEQEGKLFGLAAREEKNRQLGGQGCFLLQVTQQPKLNPKDTSWPENNTGSGYLGFGLMKSGSAEKGNEQPHREALLEKSQRSQFSLSLSFKPNTPQADINHLEETLKVWGLLGGLGGRARRGFGSVSLLSLKHNNHQLESFDDSLPQYRYKINELLNKYCDIQEYPPYSALSQHSRFEIITEPKREAREAHSVAGNAYKNHRGQPSELRGAQKIPFGLPLQNVDEDNRRSSPLFFHIHPLSDGNFVAGVLYLPAEFHYRSEYQQSDLMAFYQPVAAFLDINQGS